MAASYPGLSPTSIHYLYAPDGRLLAEHDGATGALLREYVWLDDMPLALVTGSVSTPVYHYVHTGQIGEPLIVTDASKAKVWDAAVDPWGKPVMLSTATVPLTLRLPGQWYQEAARLHQNWMRDYDPVLGVYIEADPLGIEAGQNLYGYVGGNPLNAIDPMGLCPWCRIIPPIVAGAKKVWRPVKKFWDDLSFDGPEMDRNRRICGVRYKKKTLIFRIDYAPYPGTNDEDRLHLHPGWVPKEHIPLDSRRLFE